ncbi:MAG TPA: type I 3-dehydroquinate dehydratase, partial [Anaerohalosphaeraceae bacterium]|nr:type I 3-dehydroquinate dehydratase [Anaerohalosphaeraceae bacterium]
MTYLAVSISGRNLSQFEQRLAEASQAGAEMLELRVDYLDNLTPEAVAPILAAARQSHLPTILTCRDKTEGGIGTWSQKIRTQILIEAITAGVEFVDCEFANFTGPTKAA